MVKGSTLCTLCKAEEMITHLFFQCPESIFSWNVIKDVLKWRRIPKSVND
jgi:hypothetical protein